MKLTTAPKTPPASKKAYAPPRVRSEKLLVPDLFQPSGCEPNPETGEC
ncbi:hypothetical protein ACLESO_08825 [Pyxidicoccus sp. 3LG]